MTTRKKLQKGTISLLRNLAIAAGVASVGLTSWANSACRGDNADALVAFAQANAGPDTTGKPIEIDVAALVDIHARLLSPVALLPQLDIPKVIETVLTESLAPPSPSGKSTGGNATIAQRLDFAQQQQRLRLYAETMANLLARETPATQAPCRPMEYVSTFVVAEATLHRTSQSAARLSRMVEIVTPLLEPRSLSTAPVDTWASFWLHYARATAATFANWPNSNSAPTALRDALLGIWNKVVLPVEYVAIDPKSVDAGPGRIRAVSTDCNEMKAANDLVEAYPKLVTLIYKSIVNWAINERQMSLPDSLGTLVAQVADRPFCQTLVSPVDVKKVVVALHDEQTETGNLSFSVRRLTVNHSFILATESIAKAAAAAQGGQERSASASRAQASRSTAPVENVTIGEASQQYEAALKHHADLAALQRHDRGRGWRCFDRLSYETQFIAIAKNARPRDSTWHRLEDSNSSGFVNVRRMYPELMTSCMGTYRAVLANDPEGSSGSKSGYLNWPGERNLLLSNLYGAILNYARVVDEYLAQSSPDDSTHDVKTRERFGLLVWATSFASTVLQNRHDPVVSTSAERLTLSAAYRRLAQLAMEADSRNIGPNFRRDYYRYGMAALVYDPLDINFLRSYLRRAGQDGNSGAERDVVKLYGTMAKDWNSANAPIDTAIAPYGALLANINDFLPALNGLRFCVYEISASRIDPANKDCANGGNELLALSKNAFNLQRASEGSLRARTELGAFHRRIAQGRTDVFPQATSEAR